MKDDQAEYLARGKLFQLELYQKEQGWDVKLSIEDDEQWHEVVTFDSLWIGDLRYVLESTRTALDILLATRK